MAANENIHFLEDSLNKKKVKRISIFDEPDQNSMNNSTDPLSEMPDVLLTVMYPPEYVRKVEIECDQWRQLFKHALKEGRIMKMHIGERKASVLQDSSFLKELESLDSFEADLKKYLKKAQHFCNQKLVEKRMNE